MGRFGRTGCQADMRHVPAKEREISHVGFVNLSVGGRQRAIGQRFENRFASFVISRTRVSHCQRKVDLGEHRELRRDGVVVPLGRFPGERSRQKAGGHNPLAEPSAFEIAAQQQSVKQPADLMRELEAAIQSINQFAKELAGRSHQLSSREINAAATTLLEIQEQVVSRLDEVLAKVAQLPKQQTARTPRREVA